MRSTQRRTAARGMDLLNQDTAQRLDAIGVPADIAKKLSDVGVSVSVVERLHASGLDWDYVRSLTRTHALKLPEDVAALVTFATQGMSSNEIGDWAAVGSLDAGLRLHLRNVPLSLVRTFPLTSEHGIRDFLKMLQAITETGIHIEDVLLWHTAGVITLAKPYLVPGPWTMWRSAAVNYLGMRPAALAAAAGLSVDEAVNQWLAGDFNTDALKMMAALRAGGM